MSNILKEAGMIIGEASSSEFYFSSKPEEMPSRWEYLMVHSTEDVAGKTKEVSVIAQVERIISASQALTKELDFDIIKKIVESGLADKKAWGKARVLGFLTEEGDLLQPKKAVTPGKPVYIAPPELLEKFYSYPKDEAIHIGYLITRDEVKVSLSLRGFRRHLAIIAQTGSGKSYLAGVLAEELLSKGATIVMLDPHADYVFLSRDAEGKKHEFSDRITAFRNPASTGRYSEAEVGKIQPYEICFSDLDIDEICMLSGIGDRFANIRSGIEKAVERIEVNKKVFMPKDVLTELQNADSWMDADARTKDGAKSAIKYVKQLGRMQVFTDASTSIDRMLNPKHLAVIDLSGLKDEVTDYISYKILQDIYDKVSSGAFEFPVFIFVEEAHRFIPPTPRDSTYSSGIIKRIAAEGRKFGIFLVLITQRPSKIHPDALSQCNSQIIMRLTNPEDQDAVAKSSERIGRALLDDLPGLSKGEAAIVGEMTRAPVMARIRKRKTREGGSDIDIIGKMKAATEKAKEETVDKESERLRNELSEFTKTGKEKNGQNSTSS